MILRGSCFANLFASILSAWINAIHLRPLSSPVLFPRPFSFLAPNALERLAAGYAGGIRHLKAEIALKEGQLRDYEGRIGREFAHERYRSQLADLRVELKLGLSDGTSEEARGKVGALAERIRELRVANEVEAAPERTSVRKVVRAERPVTARIQERMGEVPAIAELVMEMPESAGMPALVIPMPVKRAEDFRQNVARRRGDDRQLSLF